MKAFRLHGYAQAPVIEEVDTPALAPDEVLVRVDAAGLNPLDVQLQSGNMHGYFPLQFPYTLGTDLAGRVESTGSSVKHWRLGDAVIARVDPTRGGAMAEFAAVPVAELTRAPRDLPLQDAGGVPTAAGTAWQALFESADLQAGQTVLIHAGAGGVGSFAIQLARMAGARVVATASGSGVELARRLGADRVIDYRAERFEDRLSDVDLVLVTVRDDTQQRSFGVLRAGGTLISTTTPPDEALARAHRVKAAFVFHQSNASRLAQLVERLDNGSLNILVDRKVAMEKAGEAFAYQGSGRARGKIIVVN